MTRNERELRAVDQELVRISGEIQTIWKKAEEEDRETSNEERGDVEERLKAIETLKVKKSDVEASLKVEQNVKDVSKSLGAADPVTVDGGLQIKQLEGYARPLQEVTPGRMFVESEQFKRMAELAKSRGGLPENFNSGSVEVKTGVMDTKGTLLEGVSGTPGTGGAIAAVVPQVIPGAVQKLFQPLRVEDLLLSGQATTNALRYVVEGTATNAAAGVAEAGAKPESLVNLSAVDEPVKKVATLLPLSDEMLEDAAQVESYINGRLSLFVQIETERQIVLGAGTNELVGVAGRTGINHFGGTVDNNAIKIFKALNGQRGSAFLEPSFIVMNPANWQTTRLLTDTNGQFYGGGPFTAAYGGSQGGPVGQSGQITGSRDSLWTLPVIVTTAIGSGTALIGTTEAAQVWSRGGLSVEATNSHASFFANNLVMIRAERRVGLAVYRPAAFTLVEALT